METLEPEMGGDDVTLDTIYEAEHVSEAENNSSLAQAGMEEVSLKELVQLCAVDNELFNKTFFPKAFRQPSAPMHADMDRRLNNPNSRFVSFMCFRGSAKTTRFRAFTAKRIAYGISRTILYTSASQSHAIRSLDWIRKQVEYNTFFAQTFKLKKGKVWNAEAIEIIHEVGGFSIWVIAVGMTGQTRGVNLDDYRPDLIMVDDPCDEENTRTPEQREKTAATFFGSLQNSLAPRSECPDAMMGLAQTVLNAEDLISLCEKDSQWDSVRYSCFDEDGKSAWPLRWSTEELQKDKEGYIRRNQLSLWMREMESKIISAELSDFRSEWLVYYNTVPEHMSVYMAIDPASSDAKTADDQVIVVIGISKGKVYILEYVAAKGQNPEETASDFFRLALKWRPLACGVETISYQRVLAWFLRNEMRRRNIFVVVNEIQDRRKKRDRIRQALAGRASNGKLLCLASQTKFIQQFVDYPNVNHDDVLDAVAMAIQTASSTVLDHWEGGEQDEKIANLANWRHAP